MAFGEFVQTRKQGESVRTRVRTMKRLALVVSKGPERYAVPPVVGMTLADIREMVDAPDPDTRRTILQRHHDALGERIAQGAPALVGVAVGTFDGVHRGHQRMIAALVQHARREGGPSVVLTFDPPPVSLSEVEGVQMLRIPSFEKDTAGRVAATAVLPRRR